jgi:glycosyltransferase involved in cell wall biosynthesis
MSDAIEGLQLTFCRRPRPFLAPKKNSMPPLVSILIPAYSAEKWIAGTIESALQQTWRNKEIIIVDDGSKDQTLAVAQKFSSKSVLVTTQANAGAAAARNKAFSICKGDYIQWLDADDLLAPDKVEKQMEQAIAGGNKRTLFSSAWGSFTYQTSKAKFTPTPLWHDLPPIQWMARKIGQDLSMQTMAWLVSRELTEAAGPWNTRLLGDDDGEYFFRVVMASDGVRFIPEAKSFYRRVGFSLSYIGQSDKKLEAQFLALQLYVAHIRSLEDSAEIRKACVNCLQNYLIYFYPERRDITDQMEQMALEFGGRLEQPKLSWKYSWIKQLFGWNAAKRAQLKYNTVKMSLLRSWDKIMLGWGN